MTTKIVKTAVSAIAFLGVASIAHAQSGNTAPTGLANIAGLTASSDYTQFMDERVPDAVRVQALRKLWRVHPVIGAVDGLTDYGADAAVAQPNHGPKRTATTVTLSEDRVKRSGTGLSSRSVEGSHSGFDATGDPAQRKLWRSLRDLAASDGLTDYDDNYSDLAERSGVDRVTDITD